MTLEEVLAEQIILAGTIQAKLRDSADELPPREYKELVGAASNIVGLAHRTEESLRIIKTYQVFANVVLEFLSGRSDQLGEDLVEALRERAAELRAQADVAQVIRATSTGRA